jgi:hypothetical protein
MYRAASYPDTNYDSKIPRKLIAKAAGSDQDV